MHSTLNCTTSLQTASNAPDTAVVADDCPHILAVLSCRVLSPVLAAGADISGLSLSGSVAPAVAFRGLLDLDRMSIMGHSCGGATAAAAVAAHGGAGLGTIGGGVQKLEGFSAH